MTTHARTNISADAPRQLLVLWQRVLIGAETCQRCGDTGTAVTRAVERLREVLLAQGIDVRLETRALPPFAVAESNRIFINGEPLEELLGAQVGMNHCQSCCELLGEQSQGQIDCRTLILDGQEHEAISEELIVRAGRAAAERLLTERKESV